MQASLKQPARAHHRHNARHGAGRRRAMVVPRAQSSDAAVDSSLFKLPLFCSSSALMPTAQGNLTIFEPRYLQMFRDMAAQGGALRFGHIISASHAPPQLMADASIAGFPKVGVVAQVKTVTARDDGTLAVSYEGGKRFQILSMLETQPYALAYCMTFADTPRGSFDAEQLGALEVQVYKELVEIVRLTRQLGSSEDVGSCLPEAIHKFAPPPPEQRSSLSKVLIDAGYSSAGHSIAVWQSQGSVYGPTANSSKPNYDPYQLAANQLLGATVRQELFSFAAATCVELGNPERLALLNSRDTAGRLGWVLKAISPFRAELMAKAALHQALGTASTE